jgi:hypothetical protein
MQRSLRGSEGSQSSIGAKISTLWGGRVHLPSVVHHSFAPMIMVGVQVRMSTSYYRGVSLPQRSVGMMDDVFIWNPLCTHAALLVR